jgi:hypothetical protein
LDEEEGVGGDVGGEVEMVLCDFVFAVLVGGVRGDLAAGSVDGEIEGIVEGWTFLDVVIADELEVGGLGEDGGLVVEGAVSEVKGEAHGDDAVAEGLDEIAVGEDLSFARAQEQEAVEGALWGVDGDGVGVESERGDCQKEGEEGPLHRGGISWWLNAKR